MRLWKKLETGKNVAEDLAKLVIDTPKFVFLYIRAVGNLILAHFWTNKKSLDGQVVLVTGAATGLGRSVVLQMAQKVKLTLVLWDINEEDLLSTANSCEELGATVHTFVVDLSNRLEIINAAEKVKTDVGRVDILFNNAGLSDYSTFIEADPNREQKVINVNLMASLWTIREFLPTMIEDGRGHIVSTCSGLAFLRCKYLTSYVATKWGLKGFLETLKLELKLHPHQPEIKFSTIYPGWVKTPMISGVSWKPRYKTIFGELQPMDPDYVAERIITGIEAEEEDIMIPRSLKLISMFSGLLPREFMDHMILTLYKDFNSGNDSPSGREKL